MMESSGPPKKKVKLSSSGGGSGTGVAIGGGGAGPANINNNSSNNNRSSTHHHHHHNHHNHSHHSHASSHLHSHHQNHHGHHNHNPSSKDNNASSSGLTNNTNNNHSNAASLANSALTLSDANITNPNDSISPLVTPMLEVATEKITPDTQNSPSQVPVTQMKIADIDLEVHKHFNIVPQVSVPKCENERPAPAGAKVQPTEDILGWDSQHAYIQRWVRMTKEEQNGNVRFRVVSNNKKENLLHLLGLKNVFVKQLPNMPRAYVSRLVFDRKHESLALLKKQNDGSYIVMGGCCYRPFREQKFGEIAFLAISHTEQVRGYGTRLMAQTKEQAKQIGLTHLLTCADNQAVPYFKKQGFSNRITLEKEKWQGYIKDYDGVTLMECILHDNVDYLNIPMLLKAQKIALVEKMRQISDSHIVYTGMDAKIRRSLSFHQIPGFKQLGRLQPQQQHQDWPGAQFGFANRDKHFQEALHKHLQSVLKDIKSHDSAWPFQEPVDPETTGAYDYYDVIKNPMDLSTMQKKLDEGNFYVAKEIFKADLKRMVENCKTYNGKNQFTDMALTLEKVFMNKI